MGFRCSSPSQSGLDCLNFQALAMIGACGLFSRFVDSIVVWKCAMSAHLMANQLRNQVAGKKCTCCITAMLSHGSWVGFRISNALNLSAQD